MYAFMMMVLLGLAVLVVAKIGNCYMRQIAGHGRSCWWHSGSERPG